MICRFRRTRILSLITMALCFAGEAIARQSRAEDDFGRIAMESNEKFHRYEIETNIAFDLSAPISKRDIDRYAQILVLSAAQRQYLDQLHAEYLETIKALERGEMQELIVLSEPMKVEGVESYTWDLLAASNLMYDKVDVIARQIKSIDEGMLSRLAACLAESQKPAMARVRMHRQRACAPQFQYRVPVAAIDLSRTIEYGQYDEDVLVDIDPIRWEYEQQLTKLRTDYACACEGRERKYGELFVTSRYDDSGERVKTGSDAPKTRAIAAFQEIKIGQARIGAAIKRLADLNREYFSRFRDALPEQYRRDFDMRYRIRAYPWLFYPDRGDPKWLYEQIIAQPELAPDLKLSMEATWNTYRASYDELCRKMEVEYDGWKQFLADNGSYGKELQVYAEKFREIFAQRIQRNRDVLKQLKSMSPQEIIAKFEREIRQVEAWIDMEREKLDQPPHRFPGN
jgi:hypothetical protein